MLDYHGRVSLYSFISTFIVTLILILAKTTDTKEILIEYLWLILSGYYVVINIFLCIFLSGTSYKVAVRAAFLGMIFAIGLFVSSLAPESWHIFGWYLCFLSFFHYSEYFTTAIVNPRKLTVDSFLLNHSPEYGIAIVASWVEFLLEMWLFPGMKQFLWPWISPIGLLVCLAGETLRKLAMLTARTNFNHVVQSVREEGHCLVTNGIYHFCRHPSYVGWFYWAIGTQFILVNPLCAVAYTLASWRFFRDRVMVEEVTLLNFFGEDYYRYQKEVRTGLPFIQGYKLDL
ncbi:protein-S-isoprenylcysteine O-methyltransferase [Hetaerina americana]|uniref:protein-S-isoprenylcysteine O-methyltransferase n=1 Tax=Hetaerina americana TaxID=62018 RepID=UPI003A7F3302